MSATVRFADVTATVGVGDEGFGTGAAFGDWDLDGDLDLYVANYLDFRADPDRACFRQDSVRVYCAPWTYAPEGDAFYRNDGGRFAEVGAEMGFAVGRAREPGRGFFLIGISMGIWTCSPRAMARPICSTKTRAAISRKWV